MKTRVELIKDEVRSETEVSENTSNLKGWKKESNCASESLQRRIVRQPEINVLGGVLHSSLQLRLKVTTLAEQLSKQLNKVVNNPVTSHQQVEPISQEGCNFVSTSPVKSIFRKLKFHNLLLKKKKKITTWRQCKTKC